MKLLISASGGLGDSASSSAGAVRRHLSSDVLYLLRALPLALTTLIRLERECWRSMAEIKLYAEEPPARLFSLRDAS
ncbi:hypothetical protein EVAR_75846_1 [Eumeta japonica]|uniref:Uncharacterized protein n=1 Tax=Eumeta variegata TaxID=151549 RepID=A0A4C1TE98_EUMVA|nr:hypothetical protein EVAR_75846_1 [Eumeta japonica]